jgi:2Fe-2S ferredoxin
MSIQRRNWSSSTRPHRQACRRNSAWRECPRSALRNDIASIVAECGGGCTCATCLVHVDEKWFGVVGPPSAEEEEQLDAAFEVKPTSRLSCQIKVTEALDGLIVRTPAYQGR